MHYNMTIETVSTLKSSSVLEPPVGAYGKVIHGQIKLNGIIR